MKTASFIITNWNGSANLEKNLPAVFAAARGAEVVVVDDQSSDNSVAVLKRFSQKYPNLKILVNQKNSGFSTTTNNGVSAAKGEIVILLNNDVVPDKNLLNNALPFFDNEDVFAIGFYDLSHEKNGQVIPRGRAVGAFIRGFFMHRPGPVKEGLTLWANGGSAAFRRDLWNKIGGLYTIYNPAYGEDVDLGYRSWRAGYKTIYSLKTVTNHYHDEGALRKRYSPFYRRALTFRNQNIFMWLNISDWGILFKYFLFLPYHLFYQGIVRGNVALLVGFFWFLAKIPWLKSLRQSNMKMFKKSDKEIIGNFSPEFEIKNEELY